jgi:hypothetical protein
MVATVLEHILTPSTLTTTTTTTAATSLPNTKHVNIKKSKGLYETDCVALLDYFLF